MSFLDGLRNTIVEALRPGTRQQLGEREVLRHMYEASNNGAILPNTWYRLHNESGACVGFSYSCNCRTEYQLISAFEWMRDYRCSSCGAKFDLLRHVGVKNAEGEFTRKPDEWEALLANLPVRPRLAGTRKPRIFDTWDTDQSGEVVYTGGVDLDGIPQK